MECKGTIYECNEWIIIVWDTHRLGTHRLGYSSSGNSSSGILLKQFSDHQPYFLCLNIKQHISSNPKFVKVCTQSEESLKKFYNDIQKCDIMKAINHNPYANPNINYEIMSNLINISREAYIPTKMVKFKKYKHKKCNWITKGIIKSIQYRDNLYQRLKLTAHDSPNFNIVKTNLLCYNRILKQSMRLAKNCIFHHVLVCT